MDKVNRIQLSPTRLIPGVTTVWNKEGPNVDIVMDLKKLTFREGSVDQIVAFHVLEHFFPEEIEEALKNWKSCLKKGAELFLVVNDFQYIARSFIGGDITIDFVNHKFATPTQINRDYLVTLIEGAGFKSDLAKFWFLDVPNLIVKKDYELVLSAEKHD